MHPSLQMPLLKESTFLSELNKMQTYWDWGGSLWDGNADKERASINFARQTAEVVEYLQCISIWKGICVRCAQHSHLEKDTERASR